MATRHNDLKTYEEYLPSPMPEPSGILRNSPWWLISMGFHLVILLAAALVYVERAMAVEGIGVEIAVTEPHPTITPDKVEPERSEAPQRGIPSDEKAPPSIDPVIFHPLAELGDHLESEDGEDYHKMKGDSNEFLSYIRGESGGFRGRQAGKAKGVYDTLGVGDGGGSAGRHGDKFGGRKNIRVGGTTGVTKVTQSAVLASPKWLAHHHNPDGSWSAEGFTAQCTGGKCSGAGERDFDTGETGLALLAFLGAGYSHLSRDEFDDPIQPGRVLRFGEVVKKGVQWLIAHQDPEGCVGERTQKYMYNHTIAALALSEAYGMTASVPLKDPAQKAIDFVVASQNPGKGWRYSQKCGDNDTSVSGWGGMAPQSAGVRELKFPHNAFDGALAWFNEATERNGYYRTGYNGPGTGKVFIPNKNEAWNDHPSMSAVTVMSRIFMLKDHKDPALGAVALLAGDLPEWKETKIDFYYWYYASLALFQFDGPEGPLWKKWNEPMKNALVPHQHTGKDGCRNGSWDPEVDRWGRRT